jgi:hypothetical protein
MANGYEPGDYLGQFLAQLPQIYRAKQGCKKRTVQSGLKNNGTTIWIVY